MSEYRKLPLNKKKVTLPFRLLAAINQYYAHKERGGAHFNNAETKRRACEAVCDAARRAKFRAEIVPGVIYLHRSEREGRKVVVRISGPVFYDEVKFVAEQSIVL